MTMKAIRISLMMMVSQICFAECDFNEKIPESWLDFIPEGQEESHIEGFNKHSCEVINKYFASVGKEQRDCDESTQIIPPVLELRRLGDKIAYFASPETCSQDSSQPLYAGYALFRNGKQIGFELRVGTHNKALNWDAVTGAR